jgi:hypothetical protein
MLPFVFWNGIYCKRINEDQPGPIWHLETLSGSRYWLHFSNRSARGNHENRNQGIRTNPEL